MFFIFFLFWMVVNIVSYEQSLRTFSLEMRPPTRLLILGLVLLVAALEAADQDLHIKLSIINASPKTVATKHQKDEGYNEYIELSHEQSGKLKTYNPRFDSLPIINPVILK